MRKLSRRKQILLRIIREKPEAILVKNKYKVLLGLLRNLYGRFLDQEKKVWVIPHDRMEEFIFDAVNGNRDWQQLTEGKDKDSKEKLSEEWRAQNDYGNNIPKRFTQENK